MEMQWATTWESIADAIPDHPAITNGDDHSHVGRVRRPLGAGRRRAARGRARTRLEGRAVPLQRQRVPRGAVRHVQDPWRRRSTSTTATSTRSSGTCSTTPTPRRCSSTPRWATASPVWSIGSRTCKLLVEVDDGGPSLGDRAVPYTRRCSTRTSRCDRIERSGDDIYMLYTGGTTGMPKGVMYPMADITGFFARLGFPAAGLPVPESAVRPRADGARARRRGRDAGVDHRCTADARHRPVARNAHAPHDGWPRRHAHQPQPRCARAARRSCSATGARTTRSSATRSPSRSSRRSTRRRRAASRTTPSSLRMMVSSG